eukprot:10411096-Ditylum_brightwellii.AAC.1
MQKETIEKAITDKENAEVFAKHFSKVFNTPDPVPCNDSALPLVPQCDKFPFLGPPRVGGGPQGHHKDVKQ